VPDPLFREVPVELTAGEIRAVVGRYAAVAERCVDAGYDGVEIQAAHSSLVRQFLSPLTNHRRDGYGRDRPRFLREVLDAVREAIGPGRVLGVRICGDEGLAGGTTLDDAVTLARLVEPRVDYLNTTVGVATSTLHRVAPSMAVPRGDALPVAAAIRAAVRVPVIGIGGLDRASAERALAAGTCDLVGAVRAQIADPSFGAGPGCLGCNQECVGRTGSNRVLRCVVNPRVGREAEPVGGPTVRRRVLVAGGGPGGLRAAATAAARGHRVTLCERTSDTGGAVALAATAPARERLRTVVDDLRAECRRGGVEVRTDVTVDGGLVRRERPDAVVVATGARAVRPVWAGDLGRVVDVRDVLAGSVHPSGEVLVVDEIGFHHATSVAELLARRGAAVEIETPAMVVGQDLATTLDLPEFTCRAHALDIASRTDRVVLGAGRDGERVRMRVLHHPTGVVEERCYDWVVCAVPGEPVDGLWRDLRGAGAPVYRVGDCLAPRRVDAAVREGERVAAAL
jgi:2,4-dienoyl-CoA reductase (NADPH2)